MRAEHDHLGIMLILLFSETLHLLPPSGLSEYGREGDLASRLRHAILPTLTLGLIQMASFMRFTRSSLFEVLRQDYVRTARAKGLSAARVIWRHALRNALIPVVTVVGLSLPTLVAVGRHDWICPVEFAEEIHKLVPNSTLAIFERSGHSPQIEEREAFTRQLADFFAATAEGNP